MTRRREDGFVTLWVLAVCVMVIFLAGIAFDMWRAFSDERALSSALDGAAIAGSSGIDESVYRNSDGTVVVLDPDRARQLAAANLAAQPGAEQVTGVSIDAAPDGITVKASWPVQFTLLRVFMSDQGPLVLHASSTAKPRRSG